MHENYYYKRYVLNRLRLASNPNTRLVLTGIAEFSSQLAFNTLSITDHDYNLLRYAASSLLITLYLLDLSSAP